MKYHFEKNDVYHLYCKGLNVNPNKIDKIETAIEPKFQEHFVNASAIPNSSDTFPILETVVKLPNINFNKDEDDSKLEGRNRRRRRRQ